ncbi:MFS transporter [Tumebacillus lipolyticus]|uniref:MFS transporter n=1 Tax=Tumebacillus lipolyticus TaxID=1280370 RepID=A0ABW4ZZ33_9BACL
MGKRNIRNLLLSQFFSDVGDWITAGTIMLLIYKATESPVLVSMIMITENIAIILFATIGGAFADRHSPKKIMVVCDLVRASVVASIPLFSSNIWLIYVALLVQVSFSCFFAPAKQKVITKVANRDELAVVNSWSFGISGFVRIIGTMSAGLIVGALGYHIPFFIDATTFLISALFLLRVVYHANGSALPQNSFVDRTAKTSLLQDVLIGIKEVRRIPAVPKLLAVFTLGSFLMGLFVPQLVVYNARSLQGDEFSYGLLNAMIALGTIIATAIFPKFVHRFDPYQTMTYTAFAGLGSMLILLTLVPPPFQLAVLFFFGVLQSTPNLVATTLAQMIVPEELLGRYFGLLNLFTTSCYITGMVVGGLVASYDIDWMYRGAGLFALTVFVLTVLFRNQMQRGISYEQTQAPSAKSP